MTHLQSECSYTRAEESGKIQRRVLVLNDPSVRPFAIVTCVESLDTCIDFNLGLFAQEENPHRWEAGHFTRPLFGST
jgi:hypothetical protein